MISHGFDVHLLDHDWCWASFHESVGHLFVFFGIYLLRSTAYIFGHFVGVCVGVCECGFFPTLFFNWKIIASQNFVVFCQTGALSQPIFLIGFCFSLCDVKVVWTATSHSLWESDTPRVCENVDSFVHFAVARVSFKYLWGVWISLGIFLSIQFIVFIGSLRGSIPQNSIRPFVPNPCKHERGRGRGEVSRQYLWLSMWIFYDVFSREKNV